MARKSGGSGPRPTKLREAEFAKYHALGNDYLVVDSQRFGTRLTEHRIQAICNRNTGVGADGILELRPSRGADFGVRIHNPDGSRAEKSGNGVRILARFLYDLGYTRKKAFSIETAGGIIEVELLLRRGQVAQIRAEMGAASFQSSDIPVLGDEREVVNEGLALGGREIRVTCVSVGNPHCVVFVPRLALPELERLGPALETHPSFPNRCNVQLARVRSRSRIEALIWERGVGETLASGTSSCAIAAAAFRNGLVDDCVEVAMRGGELQVEIRDGFELRLTGPATPIFRGKTLD